MKKYIISKYNGKYIIRRKLWIGCKTEGVFNNTFDLLETVEKLPKDQIVWECKNPFEEPNTSSKPKKYYRIKVNPNWREILRKEYRIDPNTVTEEEYDELTLDSPKMFREWSEKDMRLFYIWAALARKTT